MTDELDELRLKIAKAKGYKYGQVGTQGSIPVLGFTEVVNGKEYLAFNVPDWPRDIAAAWELVEEIDAGNWFASVDRDHTRWLCFFGSNRSSEDEYYQGEGATAPEAICRAWLAWKESQP